LEPGGYRTVVSAATQARHLCRECFPQCAGGSQRARVAILERCKQAVVKVLTDPGVNDADNRVGL